VRQEVASLILQDHSVGYRGFARLHTIRHT
jgi:hypothetical protein